MYTLYRSCEIDTTRISSTTNSLSHTTLAVIYLVLQLSATPRFQMEPAGLVEIVKLVSPAFDIAFKMIAAFRDLGDIWTSIWAPRRYARACRRTSQQKAKGFDCDGEHATKGRTPCRV